MSYILEALKKAQAERARGTIPDIETRPLAPTPTDTAAKRSPLLLGGAALAVVGAAIVLAWFALTQEPAPRVKLAGAAAPQQGATGGAVAAAPSQSPSSPQSASASQSPSPSPSQLPSPAPSPSPSQAGHALAPAPAGSAAVAGPPPAATPVAVPKPKPAPRAEPVALLQDLPPQIQREIPTFAINGYIYASNPADRSVLINNRLRREGDQVAPGLTLEKLLPKEMVLNYRGYRYRIAY